MSNTFSAVAGNLKVITFIIYMYDCSNCAAATVAGMIPRCFGWDPLSTVSTTCHSWTVKFVVELSEKGENKRKKNK